MKTRFDLVQLADDLDISVEELVRLAADGQLTLHVIADNWLGKIEIDSEGDSNIKVDGAVDLLEADLEKSMNAEFTGVSRVRLKDGRIATLNEKQDISRGVHFVTSEERERLQQLMRRETFTSAGALPGYLDPSHDYYSQTLDAAVRAWVALFEAGEFVPGKASREQIELWLKGTFKTLAPNARDAICTVVNPNEFKRGGDRGKKSK